MTYSSWPFSLVYSAFRQVKALFFSCRLRHNLMDVRYSFTAFCYLPSPLFGVPFLFYYPVEKKKEDAWLHFDWISSSSLFSTF